MENNSRTEIMPGKRDFYRCCKARHSASHVNKEFWQQFQNYAPPSLRVIRTKFARTIIYNIYIRDSQLNRPESVSLARQLPGETVLHDSSKHSFWDIII